MQFVSDDGGRSAAGYKGSAGDCTVRAIAIATEKPYQEVYDDLFKRGKRSPRKGVFKRIYKPYMTDIGWQWVPTMFIGSGCQVHLNSDELPAGRIVVRLSRHLVAVINGVLHDTYDCSRDGTRCVYGYWKKSKNNA
mgnify:CR=1 FL=1|jgi:hypothetical protein